MKKLLSLAAAVIVAVFAMPLNAAPMFVAKPQQVQTGMVEPVKHWKRGHDDRHWRHGDRWDNGNHYGWRHNKHRGDRYAWRGCRYGSCYPRRYYGYRPGYYRPYYPGYYRRSGVNIFVPF